MYQPQALPRRTFLGLELKNRKVDAEPTEQGLLVLRVAEGGAGARAGVQPGDRLLSCAGVPLVDARALVAKIRAFAPGEPLDFEIERAGEIICLPGEATPLPVETIAGAEVELGFVVVNGARLRTLLTWPEGAIGKRLAVLYLQGLGTGSSELSLDPHDPTRKLFEGLTSLGLATMRVERSGIGDSEGPSCQTTSLFDEVSAYREALRVLSGDPRVSGVFLFGHSVGGMIAPLFAAEAEGLRGVVVFGTSMLGWYDCIVRATRRQRGLAGMSGAELEAYVATWSEMHHLVCREGKTPEEVFTTYPALRWIENQSCRGETMFGRHVSFFQELQGLELRWLWRTAKAPLLVLHGEYDWVCEPEEGRMIAEEVESVSPGQARFVELPGVGHEMRRHESLEMSFQDPKRGLWEGSVLRALEEWLETL